MSSKGDRGSLMIFPAVLTTLWGAALSTPGQFQYQAAVGQYTFHCAVVESLHQFGREADNS